MQVVRPERAAPALSLRVDVVPAYDAILSLSAAALPQRYEMASSWARDVRAALPAPLRPDLSLFFGDPRALGTGPMQLVPDLPSGETAALIVELESMQSADFVTVLLTRADAPAGLAPAIRRIARGKTSSDAAESVVQQYLGSLKAETRKRFREILAEPAAMHRRYLALLKAHHEGWLAEHYGEILPYLQQRARGGRRSIGKLPTKELIARLTGGFTLHSPSAQSVQLVPSYYAAPFVFVVRDGRDVVLVYGVRPADDRTASLLDAQSLRVLKALADETRLRILQLLIDKPLYGQQLADSLGVSHPTVSHHMAQLRIAGLTRTELAEDGSKTYSVQPDTIEDLCADLRARFVEPRSAAKGAR